MYDHLAVIPNDYCETWPLRKFQQILRGSTPVLLALAPQIPKARDRRASKNQQCNESKESLASAGLKRDGRGNLEGQQNASTHEDSVDVNRRREATVEEHQQDRQGRIRQQGCTLPMIGSANPIQCCDRGENKNNQKSWRPGPKAEQFPGVKIVAEHLLKGDCVETAKDAKCFQEIRRTRLGHPEMLVDHSCLDA